MTQITPQVYTTVCMYVCVYMYIYIYIHMLLVDAHDGIGGAAGSFAGVAASAVAIDNVISAA